jgi:hypothetical protein
MCDLVSLLWFYATSRMPARALGIRVDHHVRSHYWWDRSHRKLLTPRLVEAGHPLTCVSRGTKQPYQVHRAESRYSLRA